MRRATFGALSIACLAITTSPSIADPAPDAGVPAVSPSPDPATDADAGTRPAEATSTDDSYSTTISARRPLTAASADSVRARDFLLRPHNRPGDILMVTPGLFVFQHAGGGKANQYFLRGFDIDHGTDLAISVDGVPVNMLSHGHGQGYADLHFLIPEVIERIDLVKGPYDPRHGDLATAGAINLVTRKDVSEGSLTLSGGRFDTARALLMASPHIQGARSLLAAELYRTDGPFTHGEDLRRFNVFASISRPLSPRSDLSATFMTYGGGWFGSGQLPAREVAAGRLDRFGHTELFEGGNSARSSAYVRYKLREPGTDVDLLAYALEYRLRLYSNFTLFSVDPVHGDEIEQNDVRSVRGLSATYRRVFTRCGQTFDTSAGFTVRADSIDSGLHNDIARERLATVVDAHVEQVGIGVWAAEEITLNRHLRGLAGLRADYLGADVTDRLEDLGTEGDPTSGVRKGTRLSPKASVIISPVPDKLDVFLNFGVGFHSNDARGLVRRGDARGTPMSPAYGYEVGVRGKPTRKLDLAAAGFLIALDSEVVWVGDAGTTEESGATRRYGVEAEARAAILPWLFADLDFTATHAAFTGNAGNASSVALAPRLTISGGVSAQHRSGVAGRIGAVHIGDRPATEDAFLTAEGFTRLDASLSYRRSRWQLGVTAENLTNTKWREAQFATVSRLPSETSDASCPAGTRGASRGDDDGSFAGCEDVNFTPGAPINIQLALTAYF